MERKGSERTERNRSGTIDRKTSERKGTSGGLEVEMRSRSERKSLVIADNASSSKREGSRLETAGLESGEVKLQLRRKLENLQHEDRLNEEEVQRTKGRPVLFGQRIQLKNILTGAYLHASQVRPSSDPKYLKVSVQKDYSEG